MLRITADIFSGRPNLGTDFDLGAAAHLAVGPAAGGTGAAEVGQRLIDLIGRSEYSGFTAEDALPLDEPLAEASPADGVLSIIEIAL